MGKLTSNLDLVVLHGGEPVASSLAVAAGVGYPHSSVIKLIRQSADDLAEFGLIRFEIQAR